jgi:hypothetical protein
MLAPTTKVNLPSRSQYPDQRGGGAGDLRSIRLTLAQKGLQVPENLGPILSNFWAPSSVKIIEEGVY